MENKELITLLKERFGFTDKEVESKRDEILRFSYIEKNAFERKIQFYMQEFNLSKKEFRKMLKNSPALLGYNEDTVKSKEKFYMQEFNLSKKEFTKMLKNSPTLLCLNEDSAKAKKKFYIQEFNLSNEEFAKMLKILPALLSYNEDSVKAKKEFYMQEFNLSKEEFVKMLKALPSLLSYNEDSVKAKEKFYMQEFNLSKEEFVKMLKISSGLLSYKENSVKSKHKAMKELGIDDREVIKNPAFLTAPENSLKVRYMILYIANNSDSFIKYRNWQMTSHRKTWARLSWLREIGYEKIKFRDIIDREKNFIKKFKIDSGRLMEKFPFTKEAVSQINAEYEEIAKRTGGLELKLSKNDFERGK